MIAHDLKVGQIVRAPWREFGDDINLTGTVIAVVKTKRKHGTEVTVRWNGDGDVTGEGTESIFTTQEIEVVE